MEGYQRNITTCTASLLTQVMSDPSCPLTAPRAPLVSEEEPGGMRELSALDMEAAEGEGAYPAHTQPNVYIEACTCMPM
jgi:hypothetical protein